jgi:hypothetical protein
MFLHFHRSQACERFLQTARTENTGIITFDKAPDRRFALAPDSEAGVGEITPEVIKAGVDAFAAWSQMAWREDGAGRVSHMVASVYRAMTAASPEDVAG